MSGSLGGLNVVLTLDGSDQFTTSINRAGSVVQNFTKTIETNIVQVNQLSSAVTRGAGSFGGYIVTLGQLQGAFSLLSNTLTGLPQKIIDINSRLESMNLLLKGISTASSEAARSADALSEFNYLLDKAASSPFSLDKLTMSFVKLKGAGIEPVKEVLDSVVDAVAHFGGNDQTLDRVGLALQQMAGKGVVSMEELRRQLGDAVPGAMKAMASAMNVTMAQLIAAVGKGTLESKNAILQMTEEFDRLYGGSAVQKLQTYAGQIALLNTQMQRLALVAGGQDAQGKYVDGAFFKTLTDGIRQFNDYLKTPEVTAFAITVSRALAQIIEGVISAARFMHDYGDVILRVGEIAVGAVVSFRLLGAALALPAAIAASTTLATLGTYMRALGAAAAPVFAAVVTGVSNYAGAVAAMVPSTAAMTQGMGAFTTAVVSGSVGLARLVVGLVAIAAPAAAIAGLALLVYHLTQIESHGKLASDAIERVIQGDTTRSNEAAAKGELAALAQRIELLKKLKEQAEAAQARKVGAIIPEVQGSFGSKGVKRTEEADPTGGLTDWDGGGFGMAIARTAQRTPEIVKQETTAGIAALNEEISSLQATLDSRLQALMALPAVRVKQAAETAFSIIKQTFEANLFAVNNAYREKMDDIAQRREAIGSKKDPTSIDAVKGLNAEAGDARHQLYDQRLAALDVFIAQEREKKRNADQAANADLSQQIQLELGMLGEFRNSIKAQQAADDANAHGIVTNDSSKEVEKRIKQANEYLQQMESRIEQTNAQAEGANGALAKLVSYLDAAGKWGGIPQEQKDALIDITLKFEQASEGAKNFKEATKQIGIIDSNLAKSQAELERFNETLKDPGVPESRRAFEALVLSNQKALAILSAQQDGTAASAARLAAATNTAADAERNMRQAMITSEIVNLATASHEKWVSSLKPAEAAVQRQTDALGKLSSARKQLEGQRGEMKPEDYAALSKKLDLAEADTNNTRENRIAKIGAGAGKAAENTVTTMTGRVAQLKAEIAGSAGNLAKWNAELDRGKFAGRAGEIREMASEEDRLAEILKKVQVARQAESTLRTNVADAASAAEEMKLLSDQIDKRGKLLGIERELFDYKRRQQKEVIRVSNVPDDAALGLDSKARMAVAQKAADQAVESQAQEMSRKAMLQNKTDTETIMKSFDTTLKARRAAGYQEVEDFRLSQMAVVQAANLGADERARIEDQLAKTITAKRMQVDRATESGMDKWVRENLDAAAQLDKFGAAAFTQLGDALTEMMTTGKLNFSSLADWAIKEITRITLSSAFAQLLKGMGAGAGGGGIDWMGLITKGIGAIGGAWGGAAAAPAAVSGSSYGLGTGTSVGSISGFHTGGLVSSEPTFSRSLPTGMFSDVPRFHTGTYLKAGEVPAVLKDDEAVFTQGQLGAIGRMNHSYDMVEGEIGGLGAALSKLAAPPPMPASFGAPRAFDPSTAAAAAEKPNAAPPMTVNLNNQSGMGMNANAAQPRFDGEQWVLDIVLKHANQPGPLRNTLQSGKM